MIATIALIASLILAGAAWAEKPFDPHEDACPPGKYYEWNKGCVVIPANAERPTIKVDCAGWFNGDCKNALDYPVILTGKDNCLAKMEAAMKAWDDHIAKLGRSGLRANIPGELWRYELWESAKAACWRTP